MTNIEQHEAVQADLTKKIDEFKQEITPENQAKFDAVSKACKILTEANVPFYMFPYLPNPEYKFDVCYQYNNLFELRKEEGGKLTEETKELFRNVNCAVMVSFCNFINTTFCRNLDSMNFNAIFNCLQTTYLEFYNKLNNNK